jgi:hypothetical protein
MFCHLLIIPGRHHVENNPIPTTDAHTLLTLATPLVSRGFTPMPRKLSRPIQVQNSVSFRSLITPTTNKPVTPPRYYNSSFHNHLVEPGPAFRQLQHPRRPGPYYVVGDVRGVQRAACYRQPAAC